LAEEYLADTDFISVLAPRRRDPAIEPRLARWVDAHAGRLFLSVVTLAELSFGAAQARRRGAVAVAARLESWIAQVHGRFAARLLPLDAAIALRAGQLLADAVAAGRDPGMEDAMIAATAERHGLVVLIRNLADIAPMGVACCDPFAELPAGTAGP
jgi:predicted nucleic acid-binding protein